MKNISIFTLLIVLIAGCHSKSYYEVSNVNQQRFGGLQLENAQFLNESYDLILLVEDMSTLAQKRSTLKESYLLAEKASRSAKSLHASYKLEAFRLRVKLTSELSKTHDEYQHHLSDYSDENFDMMYVRYMKAKLNELDLKMETYTTSGKNERLVELADEVQDAFRSLNQDVVQINQEKPYSI